MWSYFQESCLFETAYAKPFYRGTNIFENKNYIIFGVKHWIPQKELQNADGFDLNGPVSGWVTS
ncbi:hypothetical protein CsatB_028373 [Cannabis sativa]